MKRIILIAGGVAVLVTLLAGAAFVAGRMWGAEATADDRLAGAPPIPFEGETTGATMMVEIEGASELPQRMPDTLGVFVRREDNRIFVSYSGQGVMISLDGGAVSDPDATEVEVVVTSETTVYEDVTEESFADVTEGGLGSGPPSGETIQQKLEPGMVEEIGESSIVMAWGEKRGDRLVAEILVYTGPPVIVRSP